MPATEHLRSALADRYSIERELGVGGMATVYLARDLKHDREVAIKVLRANLSAVIGSERFLSEVRISAKLDHPHILTLIDSGSADGILYYVLPYVRGESLRAKLSREKQLGVDEAVSIITQVASALDYAHSKGVVHRDIKPENILLHEGEAVLADFGIALAVKEAGGDRLTETGLSLGTPQYMSPEQATGDRALDFRSDIYSLGAVFYEMLSGEPPITGATAQAVVAKLLTERPVRLRVIRPTISTAIEQATDKALSKVPADRFSSAGQFVRALGASAPDHSPRSLRVSRKWLGIAAASIAIIGSIAWLARAKPAVSRHSGVTLRQHTQVTNSGRVTVPAISADGKTLAYIIFDCSERGCRGSLEMKDLASGTIRRLLEATMSIHALEVSPDGRNVLLSGRVNGVFGAFILSTLGGPPRLLPLGARFWAGGDSLLIVRETGAAQTFWVFVSGLDGVAVDSIRIDGPADWVNTPWPVPNSQRIIYSLPHGRTTTIVSSDRNARRYSSRSFPRGRMGPARVSSDAFWVAMLPPGGDWSQSTVSILRIPFDPRNGRIADHQDTVFTGEFTGFSVTADGGTFVVDEGTTEWTVWTLPFADALKGNFPDERRVFRGTSPVLFGLSEGSLLALSHETAAQTGDGGKWVAVPRGGGAETPIPGRHLLAWFIDSLTLAAKDAWSGGTQLSLMNFQTGRKTSVVNIPDSVTGFSTRAGPGAWAWMHVGNKIINVQRDGDSRPQKISIPSAYGRVDVLDASRDGRSLAYTGVKAGFDSLVVGIVSLPEARFFHLWTAPGQGAGVMWLNDGSLLIEVLDGLDILTLYRTRPGEKIERVGSIPRPVTGWSASRDLQNALVSTRDRHADVWMSKVVR